MEWRTLSDLSRHFLAARTVRWQTRATPSSVTVTVTGPFGTDVLTLSIPTPWPLYRAPLVWINGRPAFPAADGARLQAGLWVMRGSIVTVSLPLAAHQSVEIRIQTG